MKTSPAGVALIKLFEGLELDAYQDIAGVWTIGYGHTETAGPNQKISPEQAEDLLRRDLIPREQALSGWQVEWGVELNQNQFDALISFIYNSGFSGFKTSTAAKRLKKADHAGAAEALTWWNKAKVNGVLREIDGLTRRRAAERSLFLTRPSGETSNNPDKADLIAREITNIKPSMRCDGLAGLIMPALRKDTNP